MDAVAVISTHEIIEGYWQEVPDATRPTWHYLKKEDNKKRKPFILGIVDQIAPGLWGWMTFTNYLEKGMVYPAMVEFGVEQYKAARLCVEARFR